MIRFQEVMRQPNEMGQVAVFEVFAKLLLHFGLWKTNELLLTPWKKNTLKAVKSPNLCISPSPSYILQIIYFVQMDPNGSNVGKTW